MATSTKTRAKTDVIETGVKQADAVAKALADALSDTYRLMIKTHVYHWNVEGPHFYSIHHLTEEQYQNLFTATDELAERIRALGALAPTSVAALTAGSEIGKTVDKLSAQEMVKDLASDHENLAKSLHSLIKMAEDHDDPVTADMATARSAFHEKAAWMLRATAA
ncbi:Dps family protein [Actibacterium sp. D379-3]